MNVKPNLESKASRMSLPEFVIVLSVTLVLAAILMPAIASTNSDRAESILSSTTTAIVFDGIVQSAPDDDRLNRMSRREERRMLSSSADHGKVQEDSDTAEIERSPEVVGMEQLLTTDIRYPQP